jgi:hypothetical protein
MKHHVCFLAIFALSLSNAAASTLPPCLGGATVSTFRLVLEPKGKGPALPVNSVNVILPGEKLKYEPIHVPTPIKEKAQIAILLVRASKPSPEGEDKEKADEKEKSKEKTKEKNLVVLEARPAKYPTEWEIPARSSIVGVVFGPHGLNVKKVTSLVEKNEDLIPQLADYTEKTATVEALVQTLSKVEESPTPGQDVNSALRGFSAQYGLAVPKLDPSAPTNQQAAQLLQAVLPSMSTYDPITADRSAMVAQSAGLASSVAALFFGTPVGLAAGGAVLFENLRIMMFPDTDFHSAFTQETASNGLGLCTKDQKLKPRTRPAYLWMLRVPDVGAPAAALPGPSSLALGTKSSIKIACANPSQLKILPRLREWELTSTAHTAEVSAHVTVGTPDDTLELDLSHTKLPEGEYHLAAKWDWDPVEVKGSIDLRPFADFAHARLSPDSEDRLVEGTGWVKIDLTGADFEFVNKVTLVPPKDAVPLFSPGGADSRDGATPPGGAAPPMPPPLKGGPAPQDLTFALSGGTSGKEPMTLETEINTSLWRAGSYSLKLTQSNGTTQDLAFVIHPHNPVVSNLPLRANLGEQQQTLTLAGSGLERLEGLSSEDATWSLAPVPAGAQNLRERKATLKLSARAKKGEQFELKMNVVGLHSPLESLDAVDVLGPRPKILRATASPSRAVDVALHPGEIAAGAAVSFALSTENAGTHPTVALTCENPNDVKRPLALRPGEREGSAELDFAGEGTLYLSLDPGFVGQSGCQLLAQATVEDTGASDPHLLGRVIRLPHIEKFLLTDEKDSGHLYLGSLTGQDLQTIEKTGWDAKTGYPVQGFPTPVAGDPQEQSLQIEMPWPPPMPRAPLYVWLRGESEGRITQAKY